MAEEKRGLGSADEKTREEVARKGGEAVSRDREHMAEIGKKGGETSRGGGQQGQGGRGSNLSEEDRAKGGEHSHGGGRKSG